MHGLELNLDPDNTWLCQHADHDENPAPPTRLSLDQTLEWRLRRPKQRSITCPDCGTFWRVWVDSAIAKPSAQWNPSNPHTAKRLFRRAPILDIDRIIDAVLRELPAVQVLQHFDVWPADDEGP